MKRSEANAEIAKRLWPNAQIFPSAIGVTVIVTLSAPNETATWNGFDPFADEASARKLVEWFVDHDWTPFLDALRGILIDATGNAIGIADFMLATPEQKAKAACQVWGIEVDKGEA